MNLFPKRRPYKKGYFKVSEIHKIYYALYGNPKGIPVLFVHGGPGSGCSKMHHRLFNPKKFNIILVDQRGAGKSIPFAEIKENTTENLIEDFRKFLDYLNIRKTYLFGGSWGSFLSLCFAIKYPERVSGMVLRGIYLGDSLKDDYMWTGGPKTHFPEVWERFVKHSPDKNKPAESYIPVMFSKNMRKSVEACREVAMYEMSLLKLEQDINKIKLRDKSFVSLAKLELTFIKNNCFMPKDYIINNANKIRNIPLSIVHGRYDFVCTPDGAYKLHKALPKSKLFFVTSGHSGGDENMRIKLMEEIHKMAKK